MEAIEDFLDKTKWVLTEYGDKLVRQRIQNINMVDVLKIEVVFKLRIIFEELLDK